MTNNIQYPEDPQNNNWQNQNRIVPVFMPPAGLELLGKETGFVVGARGEALMRLETDKNLITMGSIGSGKGRSVIIPNLLTHKGSILSIEIGGASYLTTRNYREHVMGQKVFLLDPLGATGDKSASFNVFDEMDVNSSTFFADVQMISRSLLTSSDKNKPSESYFVDGPAEILTALLIYFKTSDSIADEDRNLPALANFIALYGSESFNNVMEELATDSGRYRTQYQIAGNYFHGQARNSNLDSLVSSINFSLGFARDPVVAEMLKSSSFDLRDLRSDKMSLYMVMPSTDYYKRNAAILRLITECAYRAIPHTTDSGQQFTHDDRTLFIIDEFTQLGELKTIEMMMQTARQKGIVIHALFQNLPLLENLYGKEIAATFLGNAGCIQVFDIGDERTTTFVSNKAGKQIAYLQSVTQGINYGGSTQDNWSESHATGINNSKTEGTNDNDTFNWSTAIGHSTAKNTGKTVSTGSSEGKNTSSNTTKSYKGLGFGSEDKSLRQISSGGGTQTGTNKSTSYQEGKTLTDSETKTEGGSKSKGTNSSLTEGTNEQDTNQTGGGSGEQWGAQVSVTIQGQILPKLDPADVERLLGTQNRQMIFIRANGMVENYIDFRANYDQISELRYRAHGPGDDPLLAPPVLPMLDSPVLPPTHLEDFTKAADVSYVWPCFNEDLTEKLSKSINSVHTQELLDYVDSNVAPQVENPNWNIQKAVTGFSRHIGWYDLQIKNTYSTMLDLVAPFQEVLMTIDNDIVERNDNLLKRASDVMHEVINLNSFIGDLAIYRQSLVDTIIEENLLYQNIFQYHNTIKSLAAIKLGWEEIKIPAPPKVLSEKHAPSLEDSEILAILERVLPEVKNVPEEISLSEVESFCPNFEILENAPEPYDIEKILGEALKKTVTVKHGEGSRDYNFYNTHTFNPFLKFCQNLFTFKDRKVLDQGRVAFNKMVFCDYIDRGLDHIIYVNETRESLCRVFNALSAKNDQNYKDNLRIIAEEAALFECARNIQDARDGLEQYARDLDAVNGSLYNRRVEMFNKLASWSGWDDIENKREHQYDSGLVLPMPILLMNPQKCEALLQNISLK